MNNIPPRTKPSIELNMSLLSGSPVPPAKNYPPRASTASAKPVVSGGDEQCDPSTQPHAPHEVLLREAVQWVRELETVRDDLYMLSVRNAILLDSLAMAGATEQVSDDEQDGDE